MRTEPTPPIETLLGMQCLSLQQPWASLVVSGLKGIENRTWDTDVRGRILLHASGKNDHCDWFNEWKRAAVQHGFTLPDAHELPRSAIIGEVHIVETLPIAELRRNRPELIVPPSRPSGPLCFILGDAVTYTKPIPASGLLRLWRLTPERLRTKGGAA